MRTFADDSRDSAAPAQRANTHYIRLEIRTDTLYTLINNRSLAIEDLRGLDQQAQIRIKQLLLDAITHPGCNSLD